VVAASYLEYTFFQKGLRKWKEKCIALRTESSEGKTYHLPTTQAKTKQALNLKRESS